jgi:hypothetical protein
MTKDLNYGGGWNSAVASQPCPSGHITADKKEIKIPPKLPWATSFIRKMLSEILRTDSLGNSS